MIGQHELLAEESELPRDVSEDAGQVPRLNSPVLRPHFVPSHGFVPARRWGR